MKSTSGLLLVLSFFLVLSSCGGGGSSVTSYFTTLSMLGNGDGIARGVTDTGQEALVYSPEITDVVKEANKASSSDVTNVKFSDYPITSVVGTARIRTGTATSDGETFNVTLVEDFSSGENAGIAFFEMPQGYNDVSMVTGEAYSNAPIGSFTYTGTQTSTSSKSIAPGVIGSFSMTADFSNETF